MTIQSAGRLSIDANALQRYGALYLTVGIYLLKPACDLPTHTTDKGYA